MWVLASADPGVAVSGPWWLLGSIVTAGATIAVTIVTTRRRSPRKREISSSIEEATAQYWRIFVDPLRRDVQDLRKRLAEANERAEKYRKRWEECETRRLRGRDD